MDRAIPFPTRETTLQKTPQELIRQELRWTKKRPHNSRDYGGVFTNGVYC